jgi:potassium voltage-gated channel Eag-related subfamily H protein 2
VAITVPLRASFNVEPDLWSFGFFWDAVVDIYFMVDLGLNFRTAYFNPDGTREERVSMIAARYVRGWFFVDLFSCLPISYISYFMEEEALAGSGSGLVLQAGTGDSSSSSFRAMKTLRLIKLSKMLRLARIKKILVSAA